MHRFPDGKLHEDQAIIPVVLFKAKRVSSVNAICYFYRNRSSSIMHKTFTINRFDNILGNWEDSEVLDDRGAALGLICLTEIGLDSGLKSSFGKRHFEDILVLHYVMKVDESIGYGYYIFFVSVIFFFTLSIFILFFS